ncbi:MAG: calcium/sodium antiporter [Bacteroidetes bacterium]|jgi:cation:H+ antiporter|nr:calcium/sodium antiporter [Bacteroidota bacterium]
MEVFLYLLLLGFSLSALIIGADWFVAAAEKIGIRVGISPYVVGVTIVALGTSLPEFASSVAAILKSESSIVSGNVIGSNITNILLVLGCVAAFQRMITFETKVVNVDLPILGISAFLIVFMLRDGFFSLIEGCLLILAFGIFLTNTFQSQIVKSEVNEEDRVRPLRMKTFALLVLGIVFVYFGSEYTIVSISVLAELLKMSPDFIALTLLALGTSLPELVVSLQAARRGNTGIAVGNVIGSNIFNTFGVMGLSRLFGPIVIPQNISGFGIYYSLAITLILVIMTRSKRITRFEGGMLLVLYCYYIVELYGAI